MSFLVLVGTYTTYDALAHMAAGKEEGKGIYALQFSEGKLRLLSIIPATNPAVLIPHPECPRTIFALGETILERGQVYQISIDVQPNSWDLQVHEKDTFTCNGYSTCYLTFSPDSRHAIIVNYWDSIVDVVEMTNDATISRTRQSFQQVTDRDWRQVGDKYDHWENRMAGPHAHSAHFWRNWVFIPDLGENAIFQYRFDENCNLTREAVIKLPDGGGPRHVSFHPNLDIAYVSNELNSTVCVLSLDDSEPHVVKPRITVIQTESTVLEKDRHVTNYVAEVSLSPDARFLYASNRGADSIVGFCVSQDTGRLTRIGVFSTYGKTPRHFTFSPCGAYVIVGNQDSCDVTVLGRNTETGELTEPVSRLPVPSPNFILCCRSNERIVH